MFLKILIPLVALLSTPHTPTEEARVELPTSRTIDLGLIDSDSIHSGSITLRNTGSAPLALTSVTTDCSCTAAGYPKTPIAPGDSAVITVKFDGRDYPPGEFVKMVRIRSNATNKLVKVFVRGRIKRPTKK